MLFRRRSSLHTDSSQSLRRGKGGASKSAPLLPPPQRCKGILRVTNVDDSLHTVYGSHNRRDSDLSMRSTKSEPTPRSRSVVLSTIEIREYARTVGDNPSCSSGPPVTISWEYNPDIQRLSIDDYETRRPYRRYGGEMVLTREERDALLRKEWEISRADIAAAIRETLKIKHQRRHTVQNLNKESVEVLMERAAHGLRRSLLFQSSTSQELQRLEQQYLAAQAAARAAQSQEMLAAEAKEPPQSITIHEDDGVGMHPDDEGDYEEGDVPLTIEEEEEFGPFAQVKGQKTAESASTASSRLREV